MTPKEKAEEVFIQIYEFMNDISAIRKGRIMFHFNQAIDIALQEQAKQIFEDFRLFLLDNTPFDMSRWQKLKQKHTRKK